MAGARASPGNLETERTGSLLAISKVMLFKPNFGCGEFGENRGDSVGREVNEIRD